MIKIICEYRPGLTYRAVMLNISAAPDVGDDFHTHPKIVLMEPIPSFNRSTWFNDDIAILTLDRPLTEIHMTISNDLGRIARSNELASVPSVCLAPLGSDVPPGTATIITGWGSTAYG